MTPSQKRAKTIYARNLDTLVKKIIIDNQHEDVILLPRVIIEEILDRKVEKNSKFPLFIYGKQVKAI